MRVLNPNQRTPKTATLILFLSDYNKQAESEYDTDRGFCVTGAQTNEAPVKYAVKRLAENNKKLDRIIALVTPKAEESALKRFIDTVKTVSPDTDIDRVPISDTVTTTELLQKTLEKLLPVAPSDSLIVETTGGYRNAVSALTLLSRFLRYSGTDVEFSTFSDNVAKRVTDTREIDDLFNMLDAVNVFATTGSTKKIKLLFSTWKLEEKTNFFQCADALYRTLLVCKASSVENNILKLSEAVKKIQESDYGAVSPNHVIFKSVIVNIVEQKMIFLYSQTPLLDFIQWCADNLYLQQAVTFLFESVVKNNNNQLLNYFDYQTLRILRNSINHALGEAINDDTTVKVKEEVIQKVNSLLERPEEIQDFVTKAMKTIRMRGDLLK
jgi:hypothetical protein